MPQLGNTSHRLWSKIKEFESLYCAVERLGTPILAGNPLRARLFIYLTKNSVYYTPVTSEQMTSSGSHFTWHLYPVFYGKSVSGHASGSAPHLLFIHNFQRSDSGTTIQQSHWKHIVTVRTRAKNSLHVNSLNLLHEQLHVCCTSIRLPGLKENGAIYCNPALCCI